MVFSCMNGRLRRVPARATTATALHRTQKDEEEEVTIQNSHNNHNNHNNRPAQRVVSLTPFTLPDGMITTHHIPFNSGCGTSNDNGQQYEDEHEDEHECSEIQFMLYHLKQVHRIKEEAIVDHCWSIVHLRNSDEKGDASDNANNNNNDDNNDKAMGGCDADCFWLVLAVLTRLGENHRAEDGEGSKDAISTVLLYGRPLRRMEEQERDESNGSNMFDHCFMDSKGDYYTLMPAISVSYRMAFPYFVNGIAMNRHILVVGSYIGATIYDVPNIMSKAKMDNGNENVELSGNCDTHNHEQELRQRQEQPLLSIRIMKSCIVQAMCISYPYFAAASGDRIGIWAIDDIVEHLHDPKNTDGTSESDNTLRLRKRSRLHPQSTKTQNLTTIWNTKINNGSNRVTCIGMTEGENAGDILAISCWDGSALVFQREIEIPNESESDRDNDRQSHTSRKQTWWARVTPKQSRENKKNRQRSWEDPITNSYVFPTFLALFSINIGATVRRLIAVSCPGYKHIRCYDIDSREWFKDIGSSPYHSQEVKHQVHGLVAINDNCLASDSKNKGKCKLLWIDNDDMIHEYNW